MKVLVIGGSGLFGKKAVAGLLRDPEVERVVSLDVTPPPPAFLNSIEPYADKFRYVRGDVSQLEDVLAAASENGVDRIVNYAMLMSLERDSMPRLNVKIGCLGMCNVFEAARLLGIKRVVYASSETVYGTQEDYGDREVTEDDRHHPSNLYALAKCMAEIVAEQYHGLYGIESTALRPTIGYGHGGKIPVFVRWFSEIVSLPAVGKPVALECAGTDLFSLILADDVAEFTRLALHTPSSPHPAYNLGGPPYSLRDVAAAVRNYIPDAQITFGSEPGAAGLPWKVSCARAKADYGFSVMSLEDAVLLHINEARAEAGLARLKP